MSVKMQPVSLPRIPGYKIQASLEELMKNKKVSRLHRAKRTRFKIRELGMHRLSVHRTLKHIYAQIISSCGETLASASSLEKIFRDETPNGSNIEAAKKVGSLIAQRALEQGVQIIAFDRSGYKYHGRVKALAEAARLAGLEF